MRVVAKKKKKNYGFGAGTLARLLQSDFPGHCPPPADASSFRLQPDAETRQEYSMFF